MLYVIPTLQATDIAMVDWQSTIAVYQAFKLT